MGNFSSDSGRKSKEEMNLGKLTVAGQNESTFTHWWSMNAVLGQGILLKTLRKMLGNWFECQNEYICPVPSAVKVRRKSYQETWITIQDNGLRSVLFSWVKRVGKNIGQTMVAEHKMNLPFKYHYFLPQIYFLLKILFLTILTNLHLYITHNKYVMHTKNDKSEDTEARSLVNIFMSPTLQFAVQEYFLWLTYVLLFPWKFLSTEEWGHGNICWMLAQTKSSLKISILKLGKDD